MIISVNEGYKLGDRETKDLVGWLPKADYQSVFVNRSSRRPNCQKESMQNIYYLHFIFPMTSNEINKDPV